jgi:hypothetical protein
MANPLQQLYVALLKEVLHLPILYDVDAAAVELNNVRLRSSGSVTRREWSHWRGR